ncbi:MAG: low molecular weight phosphotyrosine protein phosphatase [Burkholderiales bacterium]|jgi:protein-tyrosine phosphatase|nr:low molecular weight phosphotyrosine protein phosphatase [Burkholderiales bacterium]MCE1176909.1 low molecular weight phosphotyrosine protein phosphatase [Burkholderiales bacterium]
MRFEMVEPNSTKMKVLFVCTGNICRSPVAKAVFIKKITSSGHADKVVVDSAGTHACHVGEKADSRSQHAAAFRGYSLIGHVARQVTVEDFAQFDLILAMDWKNLRQLQNMAPEHHRHKIELIMRYAQNYDDAEVPDPYYSDQAAFNVVVDYVEDAVSGLVESVTRRMLESNAA